MRKIKLLQDITMNIITYFNLKIKIFGDYTNYIESFHHFLMLTCKNDIRI